MLEMVSYFTSTLITVPVVLVVLTLTLLWPNRSVAAIAICTGVAGKHLMMQSISADAPVTPGTVTGAGVAAGLWAWLGFAIGRSKFLGGRT